jgi:hypothetical protein
VVRVLRALGGPGAPYPHGRAALMAAIASVGPLTLAQAPSDPSLRPARETRTVTISR